MFYLIYFMTDFCLECAKSKDDCCISDYAKFTTLKDAERIANFLKKRINQCVIYNFLSEGDKKTELFIKKPHWYYYEFASKDGKVLQLNKKRNGGCLFQNENGACTIYSVRPLTCRIHPFWYSRNGEIIIDINGAECPIICKERTSKSLTENRLEKIGYKELEIKRLIKELQSEMKDYKTNLYSFLKRNNLQSV